MAGFQLASHGRFCVAGDKFVREPLANEDADNLANACQTTLEKLIVWPLLDCGLRISELCGLTPQQIQ